MNSTGSGQRPIAGLRANLRETDHLENPSVNGRIILRWTFRKWHVGAWTRSSGRRIGTGIGKCGKCAKENFRFHKMRGFLDKLRTG
jgi:hypothetical protein